MSDEILEKELGSAQVKEGNDLELSDQGGVDAGDMYRMGKDQQFKVSLPIPQLASLLETDYYLKRIFRVTTMIFFTSMVQATWEVVLMFGTSFPRPCSRANRSPVRQLEDS